VLGRPRADAFRLLDDLDGARLLVPGEHSEIRSSLDMLCEHWQVRSRILAEVDDMAMLRSLARDGDAVSIMPPVVVCDEIADGTLVEHARLSNVHENFYAIGVKRHFHNLLIADCWHASRRRSSPRDDAVSVSHAGLDACQCVGFQAMLQYHSTIPDGNTG